MTVATNNNPLGSDSRTVPRWKDHAGEVAGKSGRIKPLSNSECHYSALLILKTAVAIVGSPKLVKTEVTPVIFVA